MDSHCFSYRVFNCARFWMIMLTEISRLRMVASSLSNSSGSANSDR